MKLILVVALGLVMMGCGSTYSLKEGGWKLELVPGKGTCLTVYGDGDPEVVNVCIEKPKAIKVPLEVLKNACPEVKPEEDGGTDGVK